MKALVGTFNQEKALVASRGLLHDCEIFWNLRIGFVWSSTIYTSSSWSWRHSAASPPAINDTNQWYLGEILGPRSEILEILGPRSPGKVVIIVILSCSAWARVKCDTLFDRRKHPFHPFVSSKHPNLTLQCPKPSGLTLELQTKVRNNGEGPFSHLRHH